MSSLLLLVWSLIAAVSNMNVQAAVEVNKFGAQVYEATDMMALRKMALGIHVKGDSIDYVNLGCISGI